MKLDPSFWKLLQHLPRLARLTWRLMKDPRVPLAGKAVFCLGIAYVLWPVDLVPDLLTPIIGSFDDVALLLVSLRYLLHRTPPEVLQEHLAVLQAP